MTSARPTPSSYRPRTGSVGWAGDLFAGVAGYYVRYRRPYPKEVTDLLVERGRLDGTGTLLDAGCGTGQVFGTLARHFGNVIAIDPDPDMLSEAMSHAAALGIRNVDFVQCRAEALSAEHQAIRMAAFGASFHWMDRLLVAERVYDMLQPGGLFVALAPAGIHSGRSPWEAAVREVLTLHLGPERRAGSGTYLAGPRHEEVIALTRFAKTEVVNIAEDQTWSFDEILGFLYSTSYSSRTILGERAAAFEADLSERLTCVQPDGRFYKRAAVTVIVAVR